MDEARTSQPLGYGMAHIGTHAVGIWDSLSNLPSDETDARHWQDADSFSLIHVIGLEEAVAVGFTHPETTADAAAHIGKLLTAYRAALPFDETERGWMVETASELTRTEAMATIRSSEVLLVSRGIKRAVIGAELLSRWVAWRRGVDEFRGQGTVVTARETLEQILDSTSRGWRVVAGATDASS